MLVEDRAYAGDHLAVVDRVAQIVTVGCMPAGQVEIDVDLDRLGHFTFPRIHADQGLMAQFADEDGVGCGRGRICLSHGRWGC